MEQIHSHIYRKGQETMKKLDMTPRLMKPEEAVKVAAELQASDPDWAYTVGHDPKGTGYSRIKIYDEDGEFVSFLT